MYAIRSYYALFDLFSEVIRPLFHLETDSPVRAKVFSCSAETHYIVFCFHHIACDGDGWNLLWNELRLLYQQQLQGVEPSQVAPEFQYSAYVQRQTGVVITSYSIHYTKLYEILTSRRGLTIL